MTDLFLSPPKNEPNLDSVDFVCFGLGRLGGFKFGFENDGGRGDVVDFFFTGDFCIIFFTGDFWVIGGGFGGAGSFGLN